MLPPNYSNPEEVAISDDWCRWFKTLIKPEEECLEPVSDLIYPIVDYPREIEIVNAPGYPERFPVKAFLAIQTYWRSHLRNILPRSSRGIVIVVSNTCGPQDFTYQIDGPSTTFLGFGDQHNPKYNSINTISKSCG